MSDKLTRTERTAPRATAPARQGPVGGIKVTGYLTPQARYCAIRGGDYAVTREATATAPEEGTCTLPGEPACDALALYEGRCR